jgi:ATP synthase protein I
MDPESEKLDKLSERIRKAEAEGETKTEKAEMPDQARHVGFEFVGAIAGSGIVGAIADHYFGTSPWCLLGMVLVGFCVGMYSAWRSMQGSGDGSK